MSSTTSPTLPGMAALTTFTGGKEAPILEAGNPTASLFDEFRDSAIVFFRRHKINDPHDKVLTVLNCFRDPRIDSWIKNNKTRINEPPYSFDDLLSELRKCFLDPRWAKNLLRTVVNSKMLSDEMFETFVTRVVTGNNLLDGNPLHLSHDQLRATLEGNLASYLADHIDDLSQEEQDRILAIADYDDWKAEIKRIDCQFHSNYQCFAILHALHLARLPASSSTKFDSNTAEYPSSKRQRLSQTASPTPATGSNTINNLVASTGRTASTFRVPCPSMTDLE